MELERLQAVESLEKARQRLVNLEEDLLLAQKEAETSRETAARERAAREKAEKYASERAMELAKLQLAHGTGPAGSKSGAGGSQSPAGTLLRVDPMRAPHKPEALVAENERLVASVAEWSNRALRAELALKDLLARGESGESEAQARERALSQPRVEALEAELAALRKRLMEASATSESLRAAADRRAQEVADGQKVLALVKASAQAAEERAVAWQAKHAAEEQRGKELSAVLEALQAAAAAAAKLTQGARTGR